MVNLARKPHFNIIIDVGGNWRFPTVRRGIEDIV